MCLGVECSVVRCVNVKVCKNRVIFYHANNGTHLYSLTVAGYRSLCWCLHYLLYSTSLDFTFVWLEAMPRLALRLSLISNLVNDEIGFFGACSLPCLWEVFLPFSNVFFFFPLHCLSLWYAEVQQPWVLICGSSALAWISLQYMPYVLLSSDYFCWVRYHNFNIAKLLNLCVLFNMIFYFKFRNIWHFNIFLCSSNSSLYCIRVYFMDDVR